MINNTCISELAVKEYAALLRTLTLLHENTDNFDSHSENNLECPC